ncbi:MAG: hypothetical protein ACRC6G_10820, partial [Deefgea sp.]
MFAKIARFFRTTVIKPSHLLLALLVFLAFFGVVAWGSLALYWSNLPWSAMRTVVALIFAGFGVWALWISRKSKMRIAFAM